MARKKLTKSDAKYLEWKKNRQQESTHVEVSKPTVEVSKTAEENRRRHPEIAALVDKVREYFPGAKVTSIRPIPTTREPK